MMTDLPEPIMSDLDGFYQLQDVADAINQLLAYLREREGL